MTNIPEPIQRISRKAAQFVEAGDTIFINTSRTALHVLRFIDAPNVTVITNNVLATSIPHRSDMTLILTGGEVRYPKYAMVGDVAQRTIQSIRANKAFLGCSGLSVDKGMTTEEIDQIVYQFTVKNGGTPAPLGFCGFPKSVCTSVNDQVCHGIPDPKVVLRNGDIVNVDVSTIVDGYYGDASRMFEIGRVDQRARDLVAITKECLKRGVAAARPWGHLGDVGAACGAFAHKHHYSVVEEFGGHGVGVEFHEDPFVAHTGKKGTGVLLVPGMIFTIEPMLNEGRKGVFIDSANDWTVYTEDGSLSAQWEHTILITETGAEILTY